MGRIGAYSVFVGKPEGKRPLGDPGLDGTIILKRIFELGCGGVDWMQLAQDRYRLRAVGNEVMNLRVP